MLLVVHDAYNEGIVMSDGQLTRRNIICCFKKKNCSSFTICYIEGKCFGKYMYQVYAKWTCTCGFVYTCMFSCCNIHTGRCLLRPALLTLNWYSLNHLFSIMFLKRYILWFNAWIDIKLITLHAVWLKKYHLVHVFLFLNFLMINFKDFLSARYIVLSWLIWWKLANINILISNFYIRIHVFNKYMYVSSLVKKKSVLNPEVKAVFS